MSGATSRRVPVPPRILGLDFSGAAQAGRHIWLTWAGPRGSYLQVTRCLPAADLPGGGPEREQALAALVAHLRGSGSFVAGCDFPFGLHVSLVPEADFAAFLRAFPGRYPDAANFLAACRFAGRERALKRDCDLEARTPFAPHNLRVYRQTYHGIRDVLLPLVEGAGAVVVPLQTPVAGRPWLLETCPASALKRYGRYRPYKGRTPAHRAVRASLLAWLVAEGVRVPGGALRQHYLDDVNGDALDSLIAAWIAWHAVAREETLLPPLSAAQRIEGYVYF